MTPGKHEQEALREVLRRARQEKDNLEIGDQWQEAVMRRIREFGPIETKPGFLLMFEQFVWRLAPVMCLLIIGLAVLLSSVNFTPGYDAFQLLMNGSEELTLVQFLGL